MEPAEIQITMPAKTPLVVGNSHFFPITDFRITAEDMKKALQELNEREDVKRECLRKFKERLERDKVFLYRMDDSYLLRFLRHAQFDEDVAYNTIRNLYSIRFQHSEVFSLPPNLGTLLNYGCVTILPYRDQEGRAVSISHARKWNVDKMSFCECIIVLTAFFDIFSMNPHTQISGTLDILDVRGLSWKHLSHILHSPMKTTTAKLLQECYPARVKMIIAINCSPIVKIAYSALRYLATKDLQDKIKFFGSDMTELHQYVSPAILPKEYGGSLEETEFCGADLVMNNLPYLKYERSFGQK